LSVPDIVKRSQPIPAFVSSPHGKPAVLFVLYQIIQFVVLLSTQPFFSKSNKVKIE
jgi:hypothetical protein